MNIKEIIEELLKDEECRRALASNRKTPVKILKDLYEGVDDEVDIKRYSINRQLIQNPSTPIEIWMNLMQKMSMEYCEFDFVLHPQASPEIIEKLANKQEVEYECRDNPCISYAISGAVIPIDILEKWSVSDNVGLRAGVAGNPSTPVEILEKLLQDEEGLVKLRIADNPSTPESIIKKLFNNLPVSFDYEDVFYSFLALNPNTPREILEELEKGAYESDRVEIISDLLKNPSIPIDIINKYLNRDNRYYGYGVVSNPALTADILKELSQDDDSSIRKDVAGNPSTPVEILEKLSQDDDISFRKEVARNSSTPVEILEKLLQDEKIEVKAGVLKNTSIWTKEHLVEWNEYKDTDLDSLSLNELADIKDELKAENQKKEAEFKELTIKQKMIEEIKMLIKRNNELEKEIANLIKEQKDQTSK